MLLISTYSCKDKPVANHSESVPASQEYIDTLLAEWKKISNPTVATFTGAEMGDYFHLIFQDTLGNTLDFGNGKNKLGDVKLYDEDFVSNNEFIGKKFRITWDWKENSFYCCEGAMNNITAHVPSIVQLDLLDK